MKVERTASLEQNFNKMMLGRIDLVVSNVFSADSVIAQMHQGDRIKRLEPDLEAVPSFIAFSKQKQLADVRTAFDRKLIEIKKNGLYDQVMHAWGITTP